ncbi:hypothetical protein MHU86_4078 [Fragilaria crotonensis]|nr:hypothetical protein MHU86_4078 [Fragilaria crotonensis]
MNHTTQDKIQIADNLNDVQIIKDKQGSSPKNGLRQAKQSNKQLPLGSQEPKRQGRPSGRTVVGFTMKPTVPVPAFIAAPIMDAYVTAPEELALMIINVVVER